MLRQEYKHYHIEPFWDEEFKTLNYVHEPFNDPDKVSEWINLGFSSRFAGNMCDMRYPQPSWNNKFIAIYESMGWKDIGTSYYQMKPGTVLPEHRDLYKTYLKKFNLQGNENSIRRAVVFLEDWQPGHYIDCMGRPFVDWKAGDVVEWIYSTPHTAANIGLVDRYTLQVTGHI